MLSPPLLLPVSLFLGLACMIGRRVGLPSGDRVGVKVGLNVYKVEKERDEVRYVTLR